jgi:hypothetical protein
MPLPHDIVGRIIQDNPKTHDDVIEFLDGMSPPVVSKFWAWFELNAEPYKVSTKRFDNQKYEGSLATCYYNAQTNAINNNPPLAYCEGAFEADSTFYLHGFNITEGEAVDFTILKNTKRKKFNELSIPDVYYGIAIPIIFVKSHPPDSIINSPLLAKYFQYITNSTDKP